MKVTRKGQVTIPAAVREKHGLHPHTEVEFRSEGDRVYLVRVERSDPPGRWIVDRMRGTLRASLSTDDVMKLTRE